MQGRIYISSAFTNLKYSVCKPNKDWLDNDPHFWNSPPTWGICRTDFRNQLVKGDFIFFVLPKDSILPQMIYGYIKIRENISHIEAYKKLPQKRMGNKNPNGNIIVDQSGNYNKYDLGIHKERFDKIKNYYVIGDVKESKFLNQNKIKSLAPNFLQILNEAYKMQSNNVFSIIGRKGRILNEIQINQLLNWLK